MDLFAAGISARLLRFFPWADAAAGGAVAIGLLVLLGIANGLDWGPLPWPLFVWAAVAQSALIIGVGLAWARCPEGASGRMGWANRITLARASLVMIVAAFVAFPSVALQHAWPLAGLSLLALCLDGVDGWVARRTDSQTAFGARFDMEMDALFIMVLAALLVSANVAGPWVLAMGVIRYAFVVAGWYWTWLQEPLPDRFRRKLVCVWQIATLMVCLVPVIPDAVSTTALALALALVVYSFAVDVQWLYGHRKGVGRSSELAWGSEVDRGRDNARGRENARGRDGARGRKKVTVAHE